MLRNDINFEDEFEEIDIFQIVTAYQDERFNLYLSCKNNMLNYIDPYGLVKVIQKFFSNLVHGSRTLNNINAVVLHQTSASTAKSTLSAYKTSTKGAHYLIDKSGCIYQTAKLTDITYHVGPIKSRCWETNTCSNREKKKVKKILYRKGLSYTKRVYNLYKHEQKKSYPDRYPINKDSIGIEFVGEVGKGEKYVSLTIQQLDILKLFITVFKNRFKISDNDIYRHPEISYKNLSEAESAKW